MSKKYRKKDLISGLIGLGAIVMLCGLASSLCLIASVFNSTSTSSSIPTADANTIHTAVLGTAIAINLQTLSAQSPTPEFTLTETSTLTPQYTMTLQPVQSLTAVGASCIPNNPVQTGLVVDVVDGDTIKVLLDQDGKTYSVRYIGMDTPENTSQSEFFGVEAKAKNTELVYGKNVMLIKDVSETDRYNRLLRYVLVDDFFVNYELVVQGYANIASYPPDISCIPTFKIAEQKAAAAQIGLWANPPTLLPLPTQALPSGDDSNAPCSCSGNLYNCADFSSHASAQACYNYCISIGRGDIHKLDGDNDGSACESLP